MHISVDGSSALLPIAPPQPDTCTTPSRIATAAIHVQEWSQTDQGRASATSKQVPRATSRQPPDTHTCRARISRACTAKCAALAAAAARTVLRTSSCYLRSNSTRVPMLMSSAPAELVAGDGDLTCAGGIGFEDGFRAILVMAAAILLVVGSSSEPPTTSDDGLTAARRSTRLIAATPHHCTAEQGSTDASREWQGGGVSPCHFRLAGRVAWLLMAPISVGGRRSHRHGEGKVTVFGGYRTVIPDH